MGVDLHALVVGHLLQRHLKSWPWFPEIITASFSCVSVWFLASADEACCLRSYEALSGEAACNLHAGAVTISPSCTECAHSATASPARKSLRLVLQFLHLLWLCLACSRISLWSESFQAKSNFLELGRHFRYRHFQLRRAWSTLCKSPDGDPYANLSNQFFLRWCWGVATCNRILSSCSIS